MLYGYGLVSVATVCLLVYCALNVITTPDAQVRNLPKMVWLLLVLFFPLVGGIAWLVAGRPQGPARSLPYKGNQGIPAAYDRPGRATAASPDDDAAFLRSLHERAEQQRRAAAEQRRREQELAEAAEQRERVAREQRQRAEEQRRLEGDLGG